MRYTRRARQEIYIALFFLVPSLLGFAIFYLIPFVESIGTSFQSSSGGFSLEQYGAVVGSSSFRKAAGNTLWFTAIAVPLIVVLSLLIAMWLNQKVYIRNALRTAYVLPLVVPIASIVLLWQITFDWNGALNSVLSYFSVERIDWMKSNWSGTVVILMYIWKNLGYNVILFLAGLQNIPTSYYETADLEGAGKVRQFFGITLIYLIPTTFLVILMSILNSFKVFRETYLLAGDYPHERIYFLQHYMNNMFVSLDMEKLSAAAVIMAIGILGIVGILFQVERRFRSFME
ncbi:sugar ABC transporter permease [Paenibacillus terrigena]|uniref:carbohydrate ABC transporter permease n=1 Tax=Paenibacillus terrigena TaxID=369333 RepID=UPI0028D67067|nr:sugar ABC transporter permease [Paenibacillus terrigena]